MNKGLVSIIIVNWNGIQWLSDCFLSIKKQNYHRYEIVFVDNASTDSSVSWIRKHYPKTKVIENKVNLGFADGNNIGYKNAKGEYILFLNNDTRITQSSISELVNVLNEDSSIGGAQSKILLMDEPRRLDSIGAYLTPTGFLYHYAFGQNDAKKFDKQIDLYTAKGACMMFKRIVLENVMVEGNIFDPEYFAYFEETDMCHRIWLAGYRIVYAYKSVIYHKMGGTSGAMNNAFIQYHSFKNRVCSYLKNFTLMQMITILPIHILFCELYSVLLCFKGKFSIVGAIQKALLWNLLNIHSSMNKRKIIFNVIKKVDSIPSSLIRYPNHRYFLFLLYGGSEYNE